MCAAATTEDGKGQIWWSQEIEGPTGQLPIWAKDLVLEQFNKARNRKKRGK